MILKILILVVMIFWLVFSIPQDMFLWASTTHNVGSFDWIMSLGRALLIGFVPLLIVWVEGELRKRHGVKATRAYSRMAVEKREATDFDKFEAGYHSPERDAMNILPKLFLLVTFVIAVSYFGYYEEYGKELVAYKLPTAGGVFRVIVMAVRVVITALITYTLGRLASAFNVADLFEDIKLTLGFNSTGVKRTAANVQSVQADDSNKTEPCPDCGKLLAVGPDGTIRQALAGHKRWCQNRKG